MNFFDKYASPASFVRSPADEGGGAPAPAGGSPDAPSTGASESASDSGATNTTSTDSGDDFSGFDSAGDDFESVEIVEAGASPSPEPAAPAKPQAPVTPPAPAPAAAPVVQPAAQAPAAAPVPKEQASPPSELDTLVQSVDANQPALVDWLAKSVFTLTKEEAEAFELDAVGNVPKLMARVAVNNMKSTMNTIKSIVPQMIAAEVAKITSTQSKAKEAIGEFYSANPHLNEKDHGSLVTKWANAYRIANPQASRKEAIEYVGKAVSFEAGVVPGQTPAPRAVPFAPARPGAKQPTVTNAEPNPFEHLGADFDE